MWLQMQFYSTGFAGRYESPTVSPFLREFGQIIPPTRKGFTVGVLQSYNDVAPIMCKQRTIDDAYFANRRLRELRGHGEKLQKSGE